MALSQWTVEAIEDWDILFEVADRGSLPLAFRETLNRIEDDPDLAWGDAIPLVPSELDCRVTAVGDREGIQWRLDDGIPVIARLMFGHVPITEVRNA